MLKIKFLKERSKNIMFTILHVSLRAYIAVLRPHLGLKTHEKLRNLQIVTEQCLTIYLGTNTITIQKLLRPNYLLYSSSFSYVKKLIENYTEAEETVQLLKVS